MSYQLQYYLYESQYSKIPNRFANKAYSGLLLKLSDDQGKSGYASYHALVTFNDLPAEKFLEGFKSQQYGPSHHLILKYLQQDRQDRHLKMDALTGVFQLENHYLVTEALLMDEPFIEKLAEDHFSYIKVKMGKDIERESQHLLNLVSNLSKHKLALRIDFNEVFSAQDFEHWQSEYPLHKKGIIDFYEDPTPYAPDHWQKWSEQGLSLAKDVDANLIGKSFPGIKVLVLKPARINIIEWLKHIENPKDYYYVVTHYMDAPLGIAQAAASALKLKFFIGDRLLPCGLLPLHLKQMPENLQWPLNYRGPHLLFSEDLGLGYSKELEEVEWKTLDCRLAE